MCVAGSEGEGLVPAAVRWGGGFGEGWSEVVVWFEQLFVVYRRNMI